MSGPGVREETPSQAARRVGAAKAAFDRIRLPYPLQAEAVARMDEVRFAAIGREEAAACSGAVLVAPKGVGKTEACRVLARHAAAEVPKGERRTPVLHVVMDVEGNTGSLATAILAAGGAQRPDLGKEAVRWRKAVDMLRQMRVELLVIDEFNRAGRRPTMRGPIAISIREKILDVGVCPVIIVGSEGAATVLSNAPALLEVLDEQIDLAPLDWELDGDRAMFVGLLDALDDRLVDDGLLAEVSGLAQDDVARKLWEASSGRVRRVMKIVRAALGDALHEHGASLSIDNLEAGVDAYAIRAKLIHANPFTVAA